MRIVLKYKYLYICTIYYYMQKKACLLILLTLR